MVLKQTFIINSDLDMGKGKIAVQVAHGEVYYMELLLQNIDYQLDVLAAEAEAFDNYTMWRYEENELMKKIVLKASEKEITELMLKLKENKIWIRPVFDMGLTQICRGSLTCLVVEPLPEEKCDQLFGYLKLL